MRVVVVGGGLAGLFIGSELVSSGVDEAVVLEAGSEPGGIARTTHFGGYSLEPGASSFNLPHPHLSPILERSSVEVDQALGTTRRHVYADGRLVGLASWSRALSAPLLPFTAKLRALAEPLIPSREVPDETLGAFCRRRFGARAGNLLAWLMATGVFAGDPERLSMSAAFPAMARLEHEHGSILRGALRGRRARPSASRPWPHVPVGGMSRLADAVASSLGDRFRTGFPVVSVGSDDGVWVVEGPERLEAEVVVLAVRPEIAAGIVDDSLGRILSRATAAPVMVLGLGGEGPSPAPPGLGALVGPDEELVTLGILFESSYAADRAPSGSWLLKVIAGGATNSGFVGREEDDVVSTLVKEATRILGSEVEPAFVQLVRHDQGIPQYHVGHRQWLTAIEGELEGMPGLHVAGWGYRGVGVAGLATDASRLAREIIHPCR